MKRTRFHKALLMMLIDKGYDHGLKELCEGTGLSYNTLQKRVRQPRTIRAFEMLAIEKFLRLTSVESFELWETIKG